MDCIEVTKTQVPEIKSQTGYSFVKLATGNILFAMQCQIFAATSYFSEVCCRPRRASSKRGSALNLCARKCPPCTSVIHGTARWKACAPKFAALLLYAERHRGTEAVQRSEHVFTTKHSSPLQEVRNWEGRKHFEHISYKVHETLHFKYQRICVCLYYEYIFVVEKYKVHNALLILCSSRV